MIVVVGFIIAVLAVPLLGGHLTRLESVSFDKAWLITLAMGIQIPITTFAAGWFPESVTGAIHLLTYVLAFGFVWFNRVEVGMVILAIGAMCNFAAIAGNGGVMPASEWATQLAGLEPTEEFMNSGVVENPRLLFLGDVLAIPNGWPFANVFSIGDMLLVVGGGYMLHRLCGSKLFPRTHREMVVKEFWARFDDRQQETDRMVEVVEQTKLRAVSAEGDRSTAKFESSV